MAKVTPIRMLVCRNDNRIVYMQYSRQKEACVSPINPLEQQATER